MGMADGRTRDPDAQWKLLEEFAKKDGQLHWGDSGADRRNQKRKERLAKALQSAFGILDDPFILDGNGWKSRFQIRQT